MKAPATMLSVVVLAAGCVPYGDPHEPEPPTGVPERYEASGGEQPQSAPRSLGPRERRWWRAFDDPGLDALERRAMAGNFSLRVAWTRVERTRALARQAGAPRYPQVIPQAQVGWNSNAVSPFGTTKTFNASASVPVTYEVDWFAKYEGQHEAAQLESLAARAEVESAAMTVSANVAEAWYDLVEARARRELLEDQLEVNETFLELTQLRFRQGLTSALDVHQQRQQVAATQAQMDLVRAQERLAANQLTVLVGDMPGREQSAPPGDELPEVASLPETGVPADLLTNRPDVRAAMHRVRATDERVASAVADHLPSLVLSASAGYGWQKQDFGQRGDGDFSDALPETASGPIYNANATLTIPLFDGLARKGRIDEQRAQVHEAMETYGQTLQQAMLEVENAVAQEQEQRNRIEHLEEQLEAADDALESARDRYRQGLTGFLNVLTALQAQQQAEQSLLTARRQLLSFRIQLHRALGGTWTRELERPQPRSP